MYSVDEMILFSWGEGGEPRVWLRHPFRCVLRVAFWTGACCVFCVLYHYGRLAMHKLRLAAWGSMQQIRLQRWQRRTLMQDLCRAYPPAAERQLRTVWDVWQMLYMRRC